ncbi:hypothetical protein QTG54_004649 [Skeletonema marinoi]|uniref:SAP domain-containing protein n=2 Tax=Skeletonema marinoi TaxID=267567 RepID=A0AAD8YFG6_9STRA|nr:hypothetical protein QTG54_004649 [Skeletonema marinoi]
MVDDDLDDDEAYFLDLMYRFDDETVILKRIREHETFKQFRAHAKKGYSKLTADQIDKALDINVVKWNQFHMQLMQSVADNRASNKTNASRRSVSYMNRCTELKAKLCKAKVDFVTEDMGNDWRSVVQTFACLFIHEFERSVNEADDDLSKRIDEILEKPWVPLNDVHAETIYYIVGAMLNAAKNKIQEARTSDSLKNSLHTLIQNQSVSKKDAVEAGAPTRRVENREAVSLTYASTDLFDVVCKYESVYRALLNDTEIEKHGESLLRQVNSILSKKDVGLKNLLDLWTDESEVNEISMFLLNWYTSMRGKDYARKQNAQVINSGETHRAKIGVMHELAAERHKKERQNEAQKEQAKKDGGTAFDTFSVPILRGKCKENSLNHNGNKSELIARLRDHLRSRVSDDDGGGLTEGVETARPLVEGGGEGVSTESAETARSAEEGGGDPVRGGEAAVMDIEQEDNRAADPGLEEGKDDGEEEIPSMKMLRSQLVDLCKYYGLQRTGNKTVLLQRIRTRLQENNSSSQAEAEATAVQSAERATIDEARNLARESIDQHDFVDMYGEEEETNDDLFEQYLSDYDDN